MLQLQATLINHATTSLLGSIEIVTGKSDFWVFEKLKFAVEIEIEELEVAVEIVELRFVVEILELEVVGEIAKVESVAEIGELEFVVEFEELEFEIAVFAHLDVEDCHRLGPLVENKILA